jgi:ribosomal protein L37AE/L43A
MVRLLRDLSAAPGAARCPECQAPTHETTKPGDLMHVWQCDNGHHYTTGYVRS